MIFMLKKKTCSIFTLFLSLLLLTNYSLAKAQDKDKILSLGDVKIYKKIFEIQKKQIKHKKSKEYKKLSPKMKEAVDNIFSIMDSKPSSFLNTFEKTIKDSARKFKVKEKDLLSYFEREMLGL